MREQEAMHGRPRQRAGQAPSPLDKKEQAQVAELQKLVPLFLESNRTCCYSTESMNENARLLELNPEFYTAWNYRKRAVGHLLEREADEEARKRIAQTELDVVFRALMVNPKCYGAWYHRKWVMRFGLSSLDAEFVLLKKLLKLDARNFHGWNYRRFVAQRKGVSAGDELLFTTDKINENFSNYSAWHNRSALLTEISKKEGTEIGKVQERLEEEYDLVKNSFYTDPDDQSGWFYYCWLLGQTVAPVSTHVNGEQENVNSQEAAGSDVWQLNVLDREIHSCRELLELESNSKWTRLTLARLLLAHASYNTIACKNHINEARTHFEKLSSLDPTHREYYQHQLSMLSLNELTEGRSSLTKQYERSEELQFRQSSLCSVGFTERFSWVQNLDLSHNQLRSTHGLEALRVLVNLNLSHNRISSVTALAPLRGLPLLQKVDLSFNHIGDYTVDPCRLLFSSKLSNSSPATPDSSSTEWPLKDGKHWEIKAVFEGLRWRELNIAGNSAAEDAQFLQALNRALDGARIVTQSQ